MCSRTGLGHETSSSLHPYLLLLQDCEESVTIVWYAQNLKSRHGVGDSVIGHGLKDLQDLQDLQVGYTSSLPRSAPCALGEISTMARCGSERER
jgi:hypothetical protein